MTFFYSILSDTYRYSGRYAPSKQELQSTCLHLQQLGRNDHTSSSVSSSTFPNTALTSHNLQRLDDTTTSTQGSESRYVVSGDIIRSVPLPYNPLPPYLFSLLLLPVEGMAYLPSAVRPLMAPDSPIFDIYRPKFQVIGESLKEMTN